MALFCNKEPSTEPGEGGDYALCVGSVLHLAQYVHSAFPLDVCVRCAVAEKVVGPLLSIYVVRWSKMTYWCAQV